MTKDDAIDLIKDAGFGYLATVEKNQPRVRPIGPYLTEDNKLLVALFSHRRSIAQIKENPLVEICFVDRKMSYCRITGKAAVTPSKEQRQTVWNNMPMLRQYFSGPEDENMILIEIQISAIETMTTSDKEPQTIVF